MAKQNITTETRSGRRLRGTVVRRSGAKTVAVEVQRAVPHWLYSKRTVRTSSYLVHDPDDRVQVGEEVTIRESRPLSRRKRWVVVQKLETGNQKLETRN